ncbi:MAG: DUF4340 domain-containing protein [Candidatus Hydrogenedentes bacterium]|nr:DUF4340 domain-containing protein [Candidatus Hydrogenedentota bacterium]
MNWKATVGLAVVLCILIGVNIGLKKHAEHVKSAEDIAKKVYQVERDNIDEVRLAAKGQDEIVARKDGDTWNIIKPVEAKADKTVMERIVREFADAKKQDTVDDAATDLKPYGLDKPAITVGVKTTDDKDTEHVLAIGDQNPTKSYYYAARGGEKSVFLISNYVRNTFDKKLKDLRDKTIVTAKKGDINMIEIARDDTVIKLEKDTNWYLREPLSARADKDAVNKILDKLDTVRVDEFVNEKPDDLAKYGLDKPAAKLTVYTGDEKSAQTILFGSANDTGTGVYAKRDVASNVVLIKKDLMDTLPKGVDDIRNRKLVLAGHADINKFEYTTSEGSFTVALDKNNVWYVEKPQRVKADTMAITDLLRDLGNLKVEEFLDKAPDSAGFDKPRVKLDLWYKGKTKPVTMLIGNALPNGDLAYGQTEDGSVVTVHLDKNALDSVKKNLFDLRDKVLVNFSNSDVDHIETMYLGTRVDVARKNNNWTLIQPKGAKLSDQMGADELARSINYLKMKEIVTATTPTDLAKYGLDKPLASFTVYLKDGKTIGPFNIGDESPSNPTLFHAVHTQTPGLYLIDKSVVDSIHKWVSDVTGEKLASVTTATRDRATERVAAEQKKKAESNKTDDTTEK